MRRMPDPVVRLVAVGVIFAAAAVFGYRSLPRELKDVDYRIALATEREKAHPIKYAGANQCAMCHVDQHDLKETGYHRNVACETCHGPAQAHVEDPLETKPPLPETRRFCPTCHAYDPSRPMGFPQINPVVHNPGQPCVKCHNPHDPKPPETPSECSGCHGEIARTKAVSPHVLLACTTCHTVPDAHKITPAMVKPTKPDERAFCGTCHGQDAGKGLGIPVVDLETHHVKYLCWQCHYPHMPEVER